MYDMQPPQPVQMPQPPENKRMSVPQVMLIVLALGFAAWYLVTTLTPQAAPYATITAGVMGARYEGDGLIVRDETPFDAEGVSSVDYVAEEGSLEKRGNGCKGRYDPLPERGRKMDRQSIRREQLVDRRFLAGTDVAIVASDRGYVLPGRSAAGRETPDG